jgi:hypothetical protein
MEELLDQADALVRLAATTSEAQPQQQPRPNFPIPQELATLACRDDALVVKDDPWKGRGWFAATDIPVGQLVLIAKPIATIMDWQEYDEGDNDEDEDDDDVDGENSKEDVEPLMNELLLIETLQRIVDNPDIWHTQLSTLFPRNEADLSTLPAWVCHNDDVFIQVEDLLAQFDAMNRMIDPPTLDCTIQRFINGNVCGIVELS